MKDQVMQMNAREFMDELYKGVPADKTTYLFTRPDNATYPYTIGRMDQMLEKAMQLIKTKDVYFGLHLMDELPPQGKRSSEEKISCMSFIHEEYDVKGPAHKEQNLPETLEELLSFLHGLECPPSIIVHSGNGVHTYWLLQEYITVTDENREWIKRVVKGYEKHTHRLGMERGWKFDSVADLARVLRIPGTLNHKSNPPKQAVVIEASLTRYPLSAFEKHADTQEEYSGSKIPFIQNSHPAIVSAEVFDLTQMELEWRRSLQGSYSGKSCFSSRIVCGDCGAFYGSKVWHSTDEYRRTIWRCNNKYKGDKKCLTPHVTQEELEKAFVSVMQKVIAEKETIFTVCREVLDEALDTSELDSAAIQMQEKMMVVAVSVRKLVEENARVRRDQEEYQREYDALVAEHEKLSQQIQAIEEQKKDKVDRRRRIELFLHLLKEQKECVAFDPYTFVALVDKVVIGQDRKLEFIFRNGIRHDSVE